MAKARQRLLDEIQAGSQGHRVVNRARHLLGSVHGGSGPGARQTFMRDADVASNYASRPLSIGHGQTISQPYIMALMMEILDLRRDDWVLGIGTRSGCQTAFLNELVGRVFSIKVVETLAAAALRCLQGLGTRTPTAASSPIKTLPVASLAMIHERRNGEPLRSGLDEPAP